jgi:hypothetical protein
MERYQPRVFRFTELCRFGKWRMKLYGITCDGEFPRTELLAAAKKIAAIELAKFEPNDFHLGFLSRGDKFADLSPAGDSDPSVCVWDLALQSFERAAWNKHALLKADAPDFAGYLSDRMNSDL